MCQVSSAKRTPTKSEHSCTRHLTIYRGWPGVRLLLQCKNEKPKEHVYRKRTLGVSKWIPMYVERLISMQIYYKSLNHCFWRDIVWCNFSWDPPSKRKGRKDHVTSFHTFKGREGLLLGTNQLWKEATSLQQLLLPMWLQTLPAHNLKTCRNYRGEHTPTYNLLSSHAVRFGHKSAVYNEAKAKNSYESSELVLRINAFCSSRTCIMMLASCTKYCYLHTDAWKNIHDGINDTKMME